MNSIGQSPDAILKALAKTDRGVLKALDRAHQIVGASSRAVDDYQAAVLYTLAKAYKGKRARVLEIGTAQGFSAAVIAQAVPDAEIITLNPHVGEVEIARPKLTVFPGIRIETLKSWDYLAAYTGEPFDLIFVDGDHKHVRRDFPWWEHLAEGGLFIFHDYSPEGTYRACPPVYDALNELKAELGRDFDVLVIDDGGVGMAGFIKRPEEILSQPIRERLAEAESFSTASFTHLRGLYTIARGFAERDGALVEVGTQNGGSAAALLLALGTSRPVFLFDSFKGCPKPDPARDGDKAIRKYGVGGVWQTGDPEQAARVMASFGAADAQIVPGWFDDTLAVTATGPIAVLSIDATLYSSTRQALERFYDDVVPGGLVIVGAYHHWNGVRQAVDEFMKARTLNVKLRTLEKALWWVK